MVPGIGYADEDVGVDEHLAGCAAYQVQLQYDTAKASNSGTTVPVKLLLQNAAGTNLSRARDQGHRHRPVPQPGAGEGAGRHVRPADKSVRFALSGTEYEIDLANQRRSVPPEGRTPFRACPHGRQNGADSRRVGRISQQRSADIRFW